MRIGTWNLEGRWSRDHAELLLAQDCDVWLLTEVHDDTRLPGLALHVTRARMGSRKYWAGICTRGPLQPLPDPHPASAAAEFAGLTWCSSILPWRSCGDTTWGAGSTAEKTARAANHILSSLPSDDLVWGGDWNHAMAGREYAGSIAGRRAIHDALRERRLQLPTQNAPHRIGGLFTIDHISVPLATQVVATHRVAGEDLKGARLSDHDAYVTEVLFT